MKPKVNSDIHPMAFHIHDPSMLLFGMAAKPS